MDSYHGTTIVSVRRKTPDGQWQVALGGDGQVTLGHIVIKVGARKVRRLYHDRILAGFAGGTADAFTLFERFEAKHITGIDAVRVAHPQLDLGDREAARARGDRRAEGGREKGNARSREIVP